MSEVTDDMMRVMPRGSGDAVGHPEWPPQSRYGVTTPSDCTQ
jgi:hypothetical protein